MTGDATVGAIGANGGAVLITGCPPVGVITAGAVVALVTRDVGPAAGEILTVASGAVGAAVVDDLGTMLRRRIPGDRMAPWPVMTREATDTGRTAREIGAVAVGAGCG